jgi:hypothetical protein
MEVVASAHNPMPTMVPFNVGPHHTRTPYQVGHRHYNDGPAPKLRSHRRHAPQPHPSTEMIVNCQHCHTPRVALSSRVLPDLLAYDLAPTSKAADPLPNGGEDVARAKDSDELPAVEEKCLGKENGPPLPWRG